MKNIQINELLFLWLVQFHLLEKPDYEAEIKRELSTKLDAVVARQYYVASKYAKTEADREQAHKNYLNLREKR